MFSQPNSHSTQRALSPLPSMVRIACALRWKLKDSRRKIAGVEPPPRKGTSMGAFVRMRQPRGPPPPPLPRLRSPAPPRLPTARSASMLVRHLYALLAPQCAPWPVSLADPPPYFP